MMIEPREHLKDLDRISEIGPSRMFMKRLDRNERNIPFSKDFYERIKNKISDELIMTYPELGPVYEKLAQWLKLDIDQIMLHSGSEQVIKAIFETYILPGDKVLLHFPGFAMYEVYCRMFQAQAEGQCFNSDLFFDWDEFLNKIDSSIRMVVVENPNGFLGLVPPYDKLERMVKKSCENGVIFLIDEAYFYFQAESIAEWIKKYDNLLITRSFSKVFGLAGLRAGYLISQSRNVDFVKKVKPGFEINSIAALFISELIDYIEEVRSYSNEVYKNLIVFRKGLSELGLDTSDSKANFVAIRLGPPHLHEKLRELLRKHDILIRRSYREESLKEWVMIGVAPIEIQELLIKEIRQVLI
jgi:histidinol-phosphate aminotransferase